MSADTHEPAAHYDRVMAAWQLLLGDELHYGVFDRGDEPLDVATAALTGRMIDAADLRPGLRVLFTSGYTENAIDQDGKLEQGILFLGKPYSRAQLARMLRVALREKEARHAQEPAE